MRNHEESLARDVDGIPSSSSSTRVIGRAVVVVVVVDSLTPRMKHAEDATNEKVIGRHE